MMITPHSAPAAGQGLGCRNSYLPSLGLCGEKQCAKPRAKGVGTQARGA